jgi:hypothetical protein
MANRLGLRARLMAFVLVPCLLMGALVLERALDRRQSAREADELALLVQLAVTVGDLLHETQKERGSSSVYMSSRGPSSSRAAGPQRAPDRRPPGEVSAVRPPLRRELAPGGGRRLRMTDSQLTEIEARRRQATTCPSRCPR